MDLAVDRGDVVRMDSIKREGELQSVVLGAKNISDIVWRDKCKAPPIGLFRRVWKAGTASVSALGAGAARLEVAP